MSGRYPREVIECACGCGGLQRRFIHGHNATTRARGFWAYVEKTETCWLWTGGLSTAGYGRHLGRQAHRVAWEELVGPIPEGLELDHLCRVTTCVRPDHLEPVTHQVNLQRAKWRNQNVGKTHCHRGHAFTPENTYIRPTRAGGTSRTCRACRRKTSDPHGFFPIA